VIAVENAPCGAPFLTRFVNKDSATL